MAQPAAATKEIQMNRSATLAELAVTEAGAARVFYRHGLDFCCGGRRPLHEVCAARGLDADALLAQITAESSAAPASPRWDLRPLDELVTFIVDHYHQRLRQGLPELIAMAEKVESRHGDKPACPQGLAAHLRRIQSEVLDHLMKEEGVLFPLILAGHGHSVIGPVHVMEMEHGDHKRNLDMLRAMTTQYVAPAEACVTWRALYLGLAQLEQELMEHIHLENHVLFQRALTA
jgi:regulator of cell morphogenesis and NO signaling